MKSILSEELSVVMLRLSDEFGEHNCWVRQSGVFIVDGKKRSLAMMVYGTRFGLLPFRTRIHRYCKNGKCVNPAHMLPSSPKDKFWRKVCLSGVSDCWIWEGAKDGGGYGMFGSPGIKERKAHRISLEIYNGDIPEGMDVLHTCDNPACCNPKHLFLGTDLDNARDRVDRNRTSHNNGKINGMCKLSEDQVKEIVNLHNQGVSYRKLSKMFSIGNTQIGRIIRKETWRWIWG